MNEVVAEEFSMLREVVLGISMNIVALLHAFSLKRGLLAQRGGILHWLVHGGSHKVVVGYRVGGESHTHHVTLESLVV